MTGHVTKDGDLAGPGALEHAVDVVLAFDGDPCRGCGCSAGEQIRSRGRGGLVRDDGAGLRETGPGDLLLPAGRARRRHRPPAGGSASCRDRDPGARRQRRSDGPQASGVARSPPVPARRGGARQRRSRSGAIRRVRGRRGGARLDDPACDLAVAAAVASAAAGVPAPPGVGVRRRDRLTGVVRAAPGMAARISAARAAGLRTVFVPEVPSRRTRSRPVPVRHVMQALTWAAGRWTDAVRPRPTVPKWPKRPLTWALFAGQEPRVLPLSRFPVLVHRR